jgi:hypothetical protein
MTAHASPPRPAVEFLQALDPTTDCFVFQTFTDAADKPVPDPLARMWIGTLEEHHAWLQRMNDGGAGVFVQVNAGERRGAKHITSARAVFVDLDGTPLPQAWPLEPNIIIETSPNRYYVYWFVTDVPLSAVRPTQKHLAETFGGGGDPTVNNLDRVMRLPGYLHRKRIPALTRIVS